MPQLKVLVVGASIAGPTTAYWFAKAGANVTVIERFPELRGGGQNIDIRNIGVTTMRKMQGLEAAVRANIAPIEGLSLVRSNGRSYGVLRATGNPDQQSLLSEYEIYRGDLSRVLYDMTKDNRNVKYVFGEEVTSLQQHEKDDGPVTVEFANGFPTSQYELVVACDGATSRTRAMGLGCGVRDCVHRVNAWAAYFPLKKDILEGSHIALAHCAAPGRFVALGLDRSGVNRATMMRIHPRDDRDATLPFREASKQGDAALKNFIAHEYSGMGWKTDEIVNEMMQSEELYASEIVQVKPPSLYKGRFVMVGDAGYGPGPTGAGTSLAIAGAYLLAGEVSKHAGDLAAGLRGYEEQMSPLIHDLQQISPFGPGIMAPQTAWGLALRNYIFAFITWTQILGLISKFFANAFASSDKYPLPDYEWAA